MAFSHILKSVLPRPLFEKIRDLWNLRKRARSIALAGPVAQIYINDGETESFLGINNFFSIVLPKSHNRLKCDLVFYDADGKKILRHTLRLDDFASENLSVRELFTRKGLHSAFGLVTAQMRPVNFFDFRYRALGSVTSHFFMFYRSKSGSVGHIHPTSVFEKINSSSGDFISNQSIRLDGLKKVVLYQINPSLHRVEIEHELVDAKDLRPYHGLKRSFRLNPLGTNRTTFEISKNENESTDDVLIKVSPLPSSNSKPMLLRYYEGNRFSLSHS